MISAQTGNGRIVFLMVALAACALLMCAGSPPARAEAAPGWELSATTYPTSLVDGSDQVDDVTVGAEATTFTLGFEGEQTPSLSATASEQEVQHALEGLSSVGAGNVEVGSRSGSGAIPVTFRGLLGDTRLANLQAEGAESAVAHLGSSSGLIDVYVFNTGAAASAGKVTVTDVLPAGVLAKTAGEVLDTSRAIGSPGKGFGVDALLGHALWECTGNGPGPSPSVLGATVVTCTNNPEDFPYIEGGGGVPEPLSTFAPEPAVGISVEANPSAHPVHAENEVSIAGGGAPDSASTEDLLSNTEAGRAGLVHWDAWSSNEDGTTDTQAGSHPYTMTTLFDFATALTENGKGTIVDGEPRNVEVKLPAGFIGNLRNVPQCKGAELLEGETGQCPVSSELGTLEAHTFTSEGVAPIFNMAPPHGIPAQFGFKYAGIPVYVNFSVRTGSDDGVTAHFTIPEKESYGSVLTLWGVPNQKSHDRWRGPEGGCTNEQMEREPLNYDEYSYCLAPQNPPQNPVLTLPTSCGSAQPFTIRELSSWTDPDHESELSVPSHDSNDQAVGYTGCESLAFGPAFTDALETSQTDSPTGLVADVTAQTEGLEDPNEYAETAIKDTTVTLPAGMSINPGQAAGLRACSRAQAALEPLPDGEENTNAPSCPSGSKIGTATATSPPLEGDQERVLEGSLYVLESNPPDVKLLASLSADGVNIKLPLEAQLNETTGQITTRVLEAPQQPVGNFKLTFDGGAKATLVTPPRCGTYTTDADFTPWASPSLSDVTSDATFALEEGADGSACPSGALPFAPTLSAGTSSTLAGSFTSFSMLLSRGDGQQRVERLRFTSPAGLSALISGVPQCSEAAANAGSCPAASQIGHAVVQSGPGGDPLVLPQPGEPELPIYLTGPYDGAPFGLSIVTPVIAGPFDLGTVVTRAKIEVNPVTAQVTVATDPLPQIVKGVPTDIRSIDAIIDRPGFYFDPTSCATQQFTGTATGVEGSTAALSSRFALNGCRALSFAPKFSASTRGNGTFNRNGASLKVNIATKQGPQSDPAAATEANIEKVDVQLPVQLPSRLSTLQKACTERQFALNPAGCPEASNVGSAVVRTPVLPVALTGPAYLVSHGGAAFPDLDLVLQGDGVTIVLTGSTDIKKGVTYSRFDTTPDAPITSFELNLPERFYSALAAVGNLCSLTKAVKVKERVAERRKGHVVHVVRTVTKHVATSLSMPTTITAQNGAVVTQTTKIAVTGCAKPAKKRSAKKAGKSS